MNTAVLNKQIIHNKTIENTIWISFFVAATFLGAQVRIPLPFTPVPITLQTFFVVLSGAYLGKKSGGISQLIYLLLGGIGFPIFTKTGALLGPTGGYIVGFTLAAWISGYLREKKSNLIYCIVAGHLTLLLTGTLYLSIFVGWKNALMMGFLPFLPGDLLIKGSASYLILNRTKRFL